jgi:hypothetical protein
LDERAVPSGDAPSGIRPSSGCPGCGNAIDPLRAGHVAIFDGVFLYYCGASCKAAHLQAIASHLGDDVPTMDPPAVMQRAPSAATVEPTTQPSPTTALHVTTPAETPTPASTQLAYFASAARADAEVALAPEQAPPDDLEASTVGPQTLRSTSTTSIAPRDATSAIAPRSAPVPKREYVLYALSVVAAVAGVFVPLLAVTDAALGFRLGVATLSVACLSARLILADVEASDASRLVIGLPTAGALVAASLAVFGGEAHAAAIVSLAGLSSAMGAAIEHALWRVRRPLSTTMSGAGAPAGPAAARVDVSAPTALFTRMLLERGTAALAVVAGLAALASGGSAGWIDALAASCAVAVGCAGRAVVTCVALIHARAQQRATAQGISYKDARSFDAAGRVATAVTCSRGTVLAGEPEIVAVEEVPGSAVSESKILGLAAGAETASAHPLANAIQRAARTRGLPAEPVRSATVHAGLGVTALTSSGDRLVVGGRALLLKEQVSVAVAEARAGELEAQGRTVLLVALAGKLVGLVALQDALRAGARAAIQRLLDSGIEPVLLSGESRETCETIARALEIEHVRPEVLPSERAAEVRALADGGHVVAVIGHPSSDDAALGAADVSVAMGAPLGARAGHGDWDVGLASDDVRDAAMALAIAHAARDRSRVALVSGVAPGCVAFLAIAFGVGPLFVAPLAVLVGAASSFAVALKD